MDAGDWIVMISLLIQGAGIYALTRWLELRQTDTLYLIFAAVVVIGLALLRGLAAGVGRLIDQGEELKKSIGRM